MVTHLIGLLIEKVFSLNFFSEPVRPPAENETAAAECGAHLVEMSTTECHRSEVYELATSKSDSDPCRQKAQLDLSLLMALCNRPTPALMCNMTSMVKQADGGEAGSGTKGTRQVCGIL